MRRVESATAWGEERDTLVPSISEPQRDGTPARRIGCNSRSASWVRGAWGL